MLPGAPSAPPLYPPVCFGPGASVLPGERTEPAQRLARSRVGGEQGLREVPAHAPPGVLQGPRGEEQALRPQCSPTGRRSGFAFWCAKSLSWGTGGAGLAPTWPASHRCLGWPFLERVMTWALHGLTVSWERSCLLRRPLAPSAVWVVFTEPRWVQPGRASGVRGRPLFAGPRGGEAGWCGLTRSKSRVPGRKPRVGRGARATGAGSPRGGLQAGVVEGLLAPLLGALRPPESVLCLAGAFRGTGCACLPSGGLWSGGFS